MQCPSIGAKNQHQHGHPYHEMISNLYRLVQSLAHSMGLHNYTCQESHSTAPSPPHSTKTLSLKKALKELFPVAAKWNNLGIMLGIDKSELDMITKETLSNPHDCLREMLSIWLKSLDPLPTWSVLTEALEDIGERQLAVSLKSQFCS